MCLSTVRIVMKIDVIRALIKVCFGTICASAAKIAASYISKVFGVQRVLPLVMWVEEQILMAVRWKSFEAF